PWNATYAHVAAPEVGSAQDVNKAKALKSRQFAGFTAASKLVVARDGYKRDACGLELGKGGRYFCQDFRECVDISTRCRGIEDVSKQTDRLCSVFSTSVNSITKSR